MKRLSFGLNCCLLLFGSFLSLDAAVYSTVGDNGLTAIDLATGATKIISANKLGLQAGDDIDALSLGDDTRVFNKTRFDIFAVGKNATGSAGALKARASYGLPIEEDIYIESRTKRNKLFYRSLIKSGEIDGFDLGDIVDFEHNEILNKPIYFSLTPNSPTLSNLRASAGDILVVFPNQPSTLKVFVKASDIGNPADIDALSMNIPAPAIAYGNGYNSTTDYIIYSIANSADIYHYGYSAPVGNMPHSASEFGLAPNDTIKALEHKSIKCYDNCLHVKKGWGLFGFANAVENVDDMLKNQGSIVNAVWAYDSDNKSWKFYSPDAALISTAKSEYNITILNQLNENEGFWLQSKVEGEVCPSSQDINQTQPPSNMPTKVTFTEGPNMQVARMTHWIVPLPNGNVEVVGGHGTGFVALSSAETWNATSNTFTQTAMNAIHDMGAMVRLSNGSYLIAGGATDRGIAPGTDNIEIFDPNNITFTYAGKMLQSRTGNAGVELPNGKVLIVGGWYDNGSTAISELYNLSTQTSIATGSLNTPRSYPWVLPTNDGKAVIFWGMPPFGGTQLDSVELYDPSDNNFIKIADTMLGESGWLPFTNHLNRPIASQKMKDGKYLLWGHKDANASLIIFDPSTKTFSKFETDPVLPQTTDQYIFDVLVDSKDNAAILLTLKSGSDPQILSVYTVNLLSGKLTKMDDSYTLPNGYYLDSYSADILLSNNRIMITGGYSNRSNVNFSPVSKTLFIEFE